MINVHALWNLIFVIFTNEIITNTVNINVHLNQTYHLFNKIVIHCSIDIWTQIYEHFPQTCLDMCYMCCI